jgi:hypothetical protein
MTSGSELEEASYASLGAVSPYVAVRFGVAPFPEPVFVAPLTTSGRHVGVLVLSGLTFAVSPVFPVSSVIVSLRRLSLERIYPLDLSMAPSRDAVKP